MGIKRTQLFARAALYGLLIISASVSASADDKTNAPVSRAEYESLKKQLLQMREELQSIKGGKSTVSAPSAAPSKADSTTIGEVKKELADLKTQVDDNRLGDTKFLVTGNLSGGFVSPKNEKSNFNATFSPILLWKLSDDLLVESEVEFELEDSDTVTKLEYAQLAYSPNDYMTIGVGKFLSPINTFVERYEAKWINKFPDTPLAVYDGILPESHVGAQVRGGAPLGDIRGNYALYVGNGAKLNADNAEEVGSLQFDNFTDGNNNKSIGGRLGALFFDAFEVGYGFETAKADDASGTVGNTNYTLQSVDADYNVESAAILGRFDVRAQYAWSDVSNRTYDADGSLGFGPTSFDNSRNGGYVQASYRPTKADISALKDVEFVTRFDRIDNPSDFPGGTDEERTALGLDYWLESSTVLKLAYEFDQKKDAADNDAFLVQVATGF